MITTLIDKQDSFEIVRNQIAAILALEVANQMALATGEGKDPTPWDLKIYSERSNPWEQALNEPGNVTPIVNVWYESSNFNERSSGTVMRQDTDATYHIDCYGFGVSCEDGAGHKSGDEEAALSVQRAIRLVRNILMAAEYTYLNLRGLVGQRWPQSISIFQPQLQANYVQSVVGGRIAFRVRFNEFSPQVAEETLDVVGIEFKRAEDGQIIVEAEYDYSTP